MNENNEKVLLISPTWVGIHTDISQQLERMGYNVDFVPEISFPEDSLRVKGKKNIVSNSVSESLKTVYWGKNISKIDSYYDFLLVIDGQGINEFLFNTLKLKNPDIFCVNYLYDTTHSVYHFENNFKYFDQVFTFDRKESEKYGISLLPIYWIPADTNDIELKYDVFGFGAYSRNRFNLYRFIKDISEDLGKRTFIKTYHHDIKNRVCHVVKNFIRLLTGRDTQITLSDYSSDLITHKLLSTTDFRKIILASDVIIDSKVLDQDGLTARFMWALGSEKKIITTNTAATSYPFYSEKQILVLDENKPLDIQKINVRDFLTAKFEMSEDCRKMIENYRIDNWINTLLKKL